MKSMTCCFTGHRRIPQDQIAEVSLRLRDAIVESIENGYKYFGAGGALGFDTLAAQCILDLKRNYQDIRLILVLPCAEQAERWHESDKMEYERLRKSADKVVYTSERYFNGCMHKRNRHLVDNSSLCICYLTESTGGTAYTVEYAKRQGLKVINVGDRNSKYAQ